MFCAKSFPLGGDGNVKEILDICESEGMDPRRARVEVRVEVTNASRPKSKGGPVVKYRQVLVIPDDEAQAKMCGLESLPA